MPCIFQLSGSGLHDERDADAVYYCVIGVRIVLVCTNIPAVMQLEINKINYLHDLVQLEPHVSSEKKASRKPEVYTIVLANSKHLSRVSKTA